MKPHHHRSMPEVHHPVSKLKRRVFIETVRIERWHRRTVYGTTALLVITGVLWLIFHYFVRVAGPFGESHHPMEHWVLSLHGMAAMMSLLVLGSLVLSHMRRAWVLRRNIASGAVLCAVLVALVVTGHALYYFGNEETRPIISAIHWVIGLICTPMLVLHIFLGRRSVALKRPVFFSDTALDNKRN